MPVPTGDWPSWHPKSRDFEKLADQLIDAIDHTGWTWGNMKLTGEPFVNAFIRPVLARNQETIDGEIGCYPFNAALAHGELTAFLSQLPDWQSSKETDMAVLSDRISRLASGQLEQILKLCDCRSDP